MKKIIIIMVIILTISFAVAPQVIRQARLNSSSYDGTNHTLSWEIGGTPQGIEKYPRLSSLDLVHELAHVHMDLIKTENFYQNIEEYFNFSSKNNDFDCAIDTIFKEIEIALMAHQKEKVIKFSEIASFIYLRLFSIISWDPATGKRRDHDPRDFVDIRGLGIGWKYKYGMEDEWEDYATFLTLFIAQELFTLSLNEQSIKDFELKMVKEWGYRSLNELKKNFDIEEYVREQMAEGNFEPAAKYLYFKYIDLNFRINDEQYFKCTKELPPYITFMEVKKRLEDIPSLAVPVWTTHIIKLLDYGNQFLKKHCKE